MCPRALPARPSLEHLKNQARALLQQRKLNEPEAIARFRAYSIPSTDVKLADALHVTALEYGFDTWPALKLHVECSSENPLEALTAAVRANDTAAVRHVLVRHSSLRTQINEPLPNYGFQAPAIIAAVNHENREMIDVLLDAGANINERSRWWAGSFGVLDAANNDLADYLIARGAYLDIHAASRLGRLDRVRELLAGDPQLVHARGGDGQLPLHFAATVGLASLLLAAGADMNARDIDHESTAVQYMVSIQPHRHEVASFLIDRGAHADIFAAAALGDAALTERLLNNDPDIVRMTIHDRHFPKQNPESGGCIYIFGFGFTRSPHAIAHQFGHRAVFDLLMQRSPNWLRLVQAAEIGDEAMAAGVVERNPQLISRISNLAARRIIGLALRNNTRGLQLLLGHGWPATAALDNNQTALHFAAWHGNLAGVQALLSHGALINVFESDHGGSPLAWALHGSLHSWERQHGDYPAVTRALLAAGAQLPTPDHPLHATEEVLEVLREATEIQRP
jgi:ankyrin repeat protein